MSAMAASTKSSENIEMDQDPKGNFTLSVSNQSAAIPEVDIAIEIDGRLAIEDTFTIGSGHNVVRYTFSLSRGEHRLTASSTNGKARYEGSFEIEDTHWATMTYRFQPETAGGGGSESRSLTFEISDTPIRFK
jgi:hypothetical protein